MNAPPILITNANMRYMTARNTGIPRYRLSTTRSIFALVVAAAALRTLPVLLESTRSRIQAYLAAAITASGESVSFPITMSIPDERYVSENTPRRITLSE